VVFTIVALLLFKNYEKKGGKKTEAAAK
jgi:hypothetical protein